MTGGLLNIISHGTANVILNGNASYTVFKKKYKKHTNFGLQKFRIDYRGQRRLQTSTESVMEFTIPRYGDLLWDTYLLVTLPNIYSSVYWNQARKNSQDASGSFVPYDFRWVDELGTTMIREVEITVGSTTLARYSGEYLSILNSRDNNGTRSELWNRMTGNVDELKNPAYANHRQGVYPTTVYLEDDEGSVQPEPSIRSRQLVIPLEPWFGGESHMAFPLVAIQNQEMKVRVRLRPVEELFRVRNVIDPSFQFMYIAPNQNVPEFQIQRFLYPPTDISATEFNGISINDDEFSKMPDSWNADIHLLSTYVFLEEDEQKWFAGREQRYLIQDVFEYEIHHVQGSRRIDVDSRDCVSHFMWRFRRDDVSVRNEWSNYTNWAYDGVQPYAPQLENPHTMIPYHTDISYQSVLVDTYSNLANWEITNNTLQSQQLHTQPPVSIAGLANQKEILVDLALLMDGKYRENVFPLEIYRYVEAYSRGNKMGGNLKEGVYLYSFATTMHRHAHHPTGAMNLNKFQRIEFEINTINPPPNPTPPYENICERDEDGNVFIIGVRQNVWKQYLYGYDLRIFEERYNLLRIMGGTAGLMFAR